MDNGNYVSISTVDESTWNKLHIQSLKSPLAEGSGSKVALHVCALCVCVFVAAESQSAMSVIR